MDNTFSYADKFLSDLINLNNSCAANYPYKFFDKSKSLIESKDDHVLFVTQAIGLEKNQIDIDITNNFLTIKSNLSKTSHKLTSSINEKLKINDTIDKKNLSAKLDQGILEVKLPYKKSYNKSFKVEIS